jgi:molybdopterin molybdotransferase
VIDLEAALDIVRATQARFSEEELPIGEALGRVLSRAVLSPIDSPPFDKAAMDGFAVGAADASTRFRIRETLAAGGVPSTGIGPGECARIMTGAMLPLGAGRVIRKEFTEVKDAVATQTRPETGDNVVRRASNLRAGDPILGPRILRPQDIGILAASGVPRVWAASPPATGIIATGSEIRAAGESLEPGQIYNSNGPQLQAQLSAVGVPARSLGVVPDSPDALREALTEAMGSCELVLLTGGVSEGDFDYVPRCLQGMGAEILFHGVAVKPGKPTLFARRAGRHVFGLPGNPVSTFVIFEVFVKLFLRRLMGLDGDVPLVRGRLGTAVRRKSTERHEFLPVVWREGLVEPLPYHGSAHLNALAEAHGLIGVARGVAELEKGTEVDVRPLQA